MTLAEIQHRQEFAFEAIPAQRPLPAAGSLGVHGGDAGLCERPSTLQRKPRSSSGCCSPGGSNCRKLGLLDAGEGWLREFTEIGIEFEHMPDTGDEFLEYDLREENFEKAQSMHEAAAATAMGNMT